MKEQHKQGILDWLTGQKKEDLIVRLTAGEFRGDDDFRSGGSYYDSDEARQERKSVRNSKR